MGKGARQRKQRQNDTEVVRAVIDKEGIRKAMHKEINIQLVQAHDRFFQDETSVILYVLHKEFGWGAKRIKRFYDAYTPACDELRNHYQVSEDDMPWLTLTKLKEDGIDIDAWKKNGE